MSIKGTNSQFFPLSQLTSITPLDGRYRDSIGELSEFTSEHAIIKTRIEVEIKFLIALSENKVIRSITQKEKEFLLNLSSVLTPADIEKVKEIEKETRHDVKAMEIVLRKFLSETTLKDISEMVHIGLTSWDINDSVFKLLLKGAGEQVMIPQIKKLIVDIDDWVGKYKSLSMLARTHGQPASVTTLGKEFAVFSVRLKKQLKLLEDQKLTGKLTGAVGNFNSLEFAYPQVDWINFSEKFISSLGLTPNIVTTQINPYDDIAEYFQNLQRVNNILIGFAHDMWRYISDDWIIQDVKKGEVGSSAMPQKVNPIDFENAEGNLGMANSLMEFMSRKLAVSRLQRDLSDSTVLRNIGTVLGYTLTGVKSIRVGLSRIKPNAEKISEDLNKDWSILTEAVQVLLRKNGVTDSYSLVSTLSRGKHINGSDWIDWVEKLPTDKSSKELLKKLSPENYTGLAQKISEIVLTENKRGSK